MVDNKNRETRGGRRTRTRRGLELQKRRVFYRTSGKRKARTGGDCGGLDLREKARCSAINKERNDERQEGDGLLELDDGKSRSDRFLAKVVAGEGALRCESSKIRGKEPMVEGTNKGQQATERLRKG